MKKFVWSAMACGALMAPAFAEDAPEVVADSVIEVTAIEKTDLEAGPCDVQTLEVVTLEVTDDHVCSEDGACDHGVADDSMILTMTGGIESQSGPIRTMTGDNFRGETSLDTSLTVSQLAGEQRNALRLFDRRDAKSEAKGLKGLFARSEAKSATTITVADKTVARQKAEIDVMRDQALKTGDAKLLARADAMAASLKAPKVKQKSLFSLGVKK